jgi:imidazolonepropionase-like amidohydrolase
MKIRRLRLHPERTRRGVAVLGLALLLFPNLAGGAPQVSGRVTLAIVGGQVLDGTGAPPIADGVVLISGDRIASVGPAGGIAIPPGTKVVRADGMTVMPGLIDMHVHLAMIGSAEGGDFVRAHADREEREIMPAGARQYLMNGVTTVRDVGAPIEILKVRDRINHGELVGARLFVAGPLLQKHHSELMTGWSWEVANTEDARQKVRQLVAADVDWIKIHDQINFSEDEVAAIAEEAQRGHKPLAGHAYQNDAEIARALKYHFKTFEHTGIGRAYEYSPDTIRSIIGADVCLDPTLAVRYTFFETERFPARRNDLIASQSLPADLYQHLNSSLADYEHLAPADVDRRYAKNIRRKLEPLVLGGACIVVGTDSGEPGLIHGSTTWYELKNLMEMGMTPMEAITAATWRAGHLLAPDIGALRPGFHADVILVKGDVLADVGLLQDVAHVFKDAVQYK